VPCDSLGKDSELALVSPRLSQEDRLTGQIVLVCLSSVISQSCEFNFMWHPVSAPVNH
jgi:hypothetical protein